MTVKSVSEKNTKQEILSAYQEMVGKIATDGPLPAVTGKLQTTTNKLKEELLGNAHTLHEQLTSSIIHLMQQITDATESLTQLSKAQEIQRTQLDEEKRQLKQIEAREQEEYAYEFEKRKKRLDEELKELKTKAEAELSGKKEALKLQEDELTDLRNQVKTFEARISKEVGSAVEQVKRDLTLTFGHEKSLTFEKSSATENLLKQKIELLEQTIAQYNEETKRLQSQLVAASVQVTRIAERAVEKGTQIPPSSSKE